MSSHYSLSLRLLHWITVALVAVQALLALLNMILSEPRPILAEALVQAHISVGAVLFLLTLGRIASRRFSAVPPRSDVPILRHAATFSHGLLYLCLLVLPVTGYLKLAALGFTLSPFGLAPLPALPLNVPLAQSADRAHDVFAILLGALLGLHILAAIFHRRLDGRQVLSHIAIGCRTRRREGS